ncbi:MAG: T9SS type A sorting domain-containing protein [Bacteroidia bacterium]|nr:T9SS type A sorting domain-containing protein [Bacteroidia bacterium]
MKKIYFTIISIVACLTSVFAQTVPTCSLDPVFISSNKVGVWPDSATNFLSGTVGVPYEQKITVKVPKDTVSSGLLFCFNRFELTTPTGITNYNLPPGLMIGSSTAALANGTVNGAPSLKFPGNANNCASIYGTPTVAGSYTLALQVAPFLTPGFGSCPSNPNVNGGSALAAPQILDYYIINISAATGVIDYENDKMTLGNNYPNPATSSTAIKFYVEGENEATVMLYNTLGEVVAMQTIKTVVGENAVIFNTSTLASGTYVYSLKYKGAVATKRMTVLNN